MRIRPPLSVSLLALLLVACSPGPEPEGESARGEGGGPALRASSTGEEPAAAEDDPTFAPEGRGAPLPPGWRVRLDRAGERVEDVHVRLAEGVLYVETGPRAILYRPGDRVDSGEYEVSAAFTEIEAPPLHREAYGLLFGGRELEGEGIRYSYFLVRADGRYLVKRRAGAGTETVVPWTAHPAVRAQREGATGSLTNVLSVRVRGDGVRFLVNGEEVAVVPGAELDAHGVAGLRINHNLRVAVEGFGIRR